MASDPSAEEWVKLGVQDFKRQDYEAARVSFGHAYSVDPNAAVLLNLALAELQSGHPVDAIRHLRSYLKDPSADPAKVTVVLAKWMPLAEGQTARLAVDGPSGSEIVVDGQKLGTTPLPEPLDVSPGEHDVGLLSATATASKTLHVTTVAGQTSRVTFLSPEQQGPPTETAFPTVAPTAATIDGTPQESRGSSGFWTPKVIAVGSMGVAALTAAALGVVYALDSESASSTASSLRANMPVGFCRDNASSSSCVSLKNATQSESWNYWASTGMYIGAGVLAGAAIGTWFLWPKERSPSAWMVQPIIDGRTGGALVGTSF
jgi:tetratricopeptide (TPR) repeat protein